MRPSILLIQGVGLVGEGWRPQVDDLSDAFEPVTFDNRGIGAGPALDGPLTIEQMAADALAVMDRLGVDRVETVMVGDSWPNDIAGAAAAGLRTVWFNRTDLARPEDPAGVRELRALEPVAQVLDAILGDAQ